MDTSDHTVTQCVSNICGCIILHGIGEMTDISTEQLLRQTIHHKSNRSSPSVCGVTWSPKGHLYYFNNLCHHLNSIKHTNNSVDYSLPDTLDEYMQLPIQQNKLHVVSSRQHTTISPLFDIHTNTDSSKSPHDLSTLSTTSLSRNTSGNSIHESSESDGSDNENETNDYIKSIYNRQYSATSQDTKANNPNSIVPRIFYTNNNDSNNINIDENSSDSELVGLALHRRTSIQSPLHSSRNTPKVQSSTNHLNYTSINTSIAVFDVACCVPIDINLAQHYRCTIDENNSMDDICAYNANQCIMHNRVELIDTWQLVQQLFQPIKSLNDYDDQQYYPYSLSSNGGLAIQAIINQFANTGDIQHAAVFSSLYIQVLHYYMKQNTQVNVDDTDTHSDSDSKIQHSKLKRAVSELHVQSDRLITSQSYAYMLSSYDDTTTQQQIRTIHSTSNILHVGSLRITPPITPRNMINSASHSFITKSMHSNRTPSDISEVSQSMDHIELDHVIDINDMYKLCYSEYLLRNNLVQQRGEIMKSCYTVSDNDINEYTIDIQHDDQLLQCVICNQLIRGSALCCLMCEHTGHTQHLTQWFDTVSSYCPTGCGCQCLLDNS